MTSVGAVTYRADLPPMPSRITSLPIDAKGYPVPKFVAWIDGKPDFRVVEPAHLTACVKYNVCWLCGGPLGAYKTFVVGPMCAINKVSSEPPSHLACAEYAAQACPFMVRPKAKRREGNLPDNAGMAGCPVLRNPGVTLLWTTKRYRMVADSVGKGVLFDMGAPIATVWYAQGRPATREEVIQSMDEGYPALLALAETEGPGAVSELVAARAAAGELLP